MWCPIVVRLEVELMSESRMGWYFVYSLGEERWAGALQTADGRFACAAVAPDGPGCLADQWEKVENIEDGVFDVYVPGDGFFAALERDGAGGDVAAFVEGLVPSGDELVLRHFGRYRPLKGAEEVYKSLSQSFVEDEMGPDVVGDVMYRDAEDNDVAAPVMHSWWVDPEDPRDGVSVCGANAGRGVEDLDLESENASDVPMETDFVDPGVGGEDTESRSGVEGLDLEGRDAGQGE